MILLTGGAGFIGSYIHAELAKRGDKSTIVDWLGSSGKWQNLRSHAPAAIIRPESLSERDLRGIRAVIHLGAVSETTATDGDLTWETNVALPQRLWTWCTVVGIPFLYASSAATYGDGSSGFSDAHHELPNLRPLNLYGWTKHSFDEWALAQAALGNSPPQWAGLKFFNVYGPNEYHKGNMISVVKAKHDQVAAGKPPTLFRSCEPDVEDGMQKRDFVWVGDVASVVMWLLDNPIVSGIYNVGTGRARSYLDLAHAVCVSSGSESLGVEFIDTPAHLVGKYQSFTEADMARLIGAGYGKAFKSLEEGIDIYVREYLRNGPYYH